MAQNWKHIVPKSELPKHDTAWPKDNQSACPCKPLVDADNRIVAHRPLPE